MIPLKLFSNNRNLLKFGTLQHHKANFDAKRLLSTTTTSLSDFVTFLHNNSCVKTAEELLIDVHDKLDLSWSATILTSMLIARSLITVPLFVYQQVVLARLENLQLELPDIKQKILSDIACHRSLHNWSDNTCQLNYNQSLSEEYKKLILRDNCHPMKAGLLMFIQVPIWLSGSLALRNLCFPLPNSGEHIYIASQQIADESFLWIDSLTNADYTLIIPLTIGLLNFVAVELNVLKRIVLPNKFQTIIQNFFRCFSVLLIPISAQLPTCVTLYWMSSLVFGLFQNIVIIVPKVRRCLRIPETARDLDRPFEYMKQEIVYKFRKFSS